MKPKILEWLKRYAPAEVASIVVSLTCGLVTELLFLNPVLTALAGTWGDNIGYYGRIIYVDIKERRRLDFGTTWKGMLKVARNIIVEFGPGEYFDSLIIRPAVMYILLVTIDNTILALLLGKVLADTVFYIPTLFFYELRKKHLKD